MDRPNRTHNPDQPPSAGLHVPRGRGVALLPGQDVLVPVRFGGPSSPRHDMVLRFGLMEPDGVVPGHLVARTVQGPIAAKRAVVWDPVLDTFSVGDRRALEQLFHRLDPWSALAGIVAGVIKVVMQAAGELLGEMLSPNVVIVGGLFSVLAAYVLYYWLWAALAQILFIYAFLPGMAVLLTCSVLHGVRQQRLHTALFQAAWHAYDPARYHAPD